MLHADICLAGAGIIGLSLALELQERGASVVVIEAGSPLRQASTAAAGMLAADDPDNPPEIAALSRFSLSLYTDFLARIEKLSGISVPYQTEFTLQSCDRPQTPEPSSRQDVAQEDADRIRHKGVQQVVQQEVQRKIDSLLAPGLTGFQLFRERSIDPRQLAPALLAAVESVPITLLTDTRPRSIHSTSQAVTIDTAEHTIEARHFVDCTGAWASDAPYSVIPVKGQMLALAIPRDLPLDLTLRSPHFYIVPRLHGPSAGRVIVGATVEDAGFDTTVQPADLAALQVKAAGFIPALERAERLDSWAGLRPASFDRLPLLGPHPTLPCRFVAAGHYRNGILQAPGTAHVIADLLQGTRPAVNLAAFAPARFLMHQAALADK